MKIAVCVKQVPVLSRIQFDHETKTIVREGVPQEINSFDLLAVGRAVKLREEVGGEVVAITMGPPQARDGLIQCLALGADRAVHLTDKTMAGSDTLATARSLALALEREEFDLVLCGRNSTDAETGQVGPEIAQLLHLPYVGNVRKLQYNKDDKSILVERVTDEGYELIECPLPGLIAVTEGIMPERWPSRQEMESARENPAIDEVTAAQLSTDVSIFGATGSPTWVADIRLVEPQRLGFVIEEPDPHLAAKKVIEGLKGRSQTTPSHTSLKAWSQYPKSKESGIWVVAERLKTGPSMAHSPGLRKVTLELLGKARDLAEHRRCEVTAILIGPADTDDTKALTAHGADSVLVLDGPGLGHITGSASTETLANAIAAQVPYAVLFAATANGRDLASRVAARLGLGLTGDCIELEINDSGDLVQLKPALGGNVVALILSKTRPYMVTLRPGLLTPFEPDWSQTPSVATIEVKESGKPDIKVLEVHTQEDSRGLQLEVAKVVMAVGMGIGGPENLSAIHKLAESIGATVAATRNVTDVGWLPKQVQVGLTGRAIAPELYIAVGVRGDFNHMVGIQKAGTIVAINNNPNPRRSPILQAADYSIVGDWQTYLPPLVEALKPLLNKDERG